MKKIFLLSLALLSSIASFAYDFAAENADGVTIYYNYINDGKELEVTKMSTIGSSNYSGSVSIPEEVTYMSHTRKVTSIGRQAFYTCSVISVNIPNSVATIGSQAFCFCSNLTSVTIPNSVTTISSNAFYYCEALTSITIPNSVTSIGNTVFSGCKALTSITIPNSVTSIENETFSGCTSLTSVDIPNSVTNIGSYAFSGCLGLISVIIPNSVTEIGYAAFSGCNNLTSVTIPNSVTNIGDVAFNKCTGLTSVISKMKNPCEIDSKCFTDDVFYNITLYVPKGTIEKYKSTDYWSKFTFIEEGDGPNGSADTKQCEKPTIGYQNGQLTFNCGTPEAEFHYMINDSDIKSGIGESIDLAVTYEVSVYASASGYNNSETATATLCWIDVAPKTEGITDGIAQVQARPVMITAESGIVSISGAADGEQIIVFSADGEQEGAAIARNGAAEIPTHLQSSSVAIVKIGQKTIKVAMK